jgi:hypothetical protein
LEDYHSRGRASAQRHDRAHGAGRADDRGLVSRLFGAGAGSDAQAWRRGDPGQPASPQGVRRARAIQAAGARLLFLPAYSPDFNPIENAFAKLKALLRKAAARTIDELWAAIGNSLDTFKPDECANGFGAAGDDAS